MRYLHIEVPEHQSIVDTILEDFNAKFNYFVSDNAVEPDSMNVTVSLYHWEEYFRQEGLLEKEYCKNGAGRLYMRKDRWYGPNATYGISYYQNNSNYGSLPATSAPTGLYYGATGVHVHKTGVLRKIRILGRFNGNGIEPHFAVNAQTKEAGTNNVEDRILYHDLVPIITGASSNTNYLIELDINREVFEDEIITLLVNRSDNTGSTRYLYAAAIEFIFE